MTDNEQFPQTFTHELFMHDSNPRNVALVRAKDALPAPKTVFQPVRALISGTTYIITISAAFIGVIGASAYFFATHETTFKPTQQETTTPNENNTLEQLCRTHNLDQTLLKNIMNVYSNPQISSTFIDEHYCLLAQETGILEHVLREESALFTHAVARRLAHIRDETNMALVVNDSQKATILAYWIPDETLRRKVLTEFQSYKRLLFNDLGNGFADGRRTGMRLQLNYEYERRLRTQENTPEELARFKQFITTMKGFSEDNYFNDFALRVTPQWVKVTPLPPECIPALRATVGIPLDLLIIDNEQH